MKYIISSSSALTRGDSNCSVNRRNLIAAAVVVIGSSVAGCLENREPTGDLDESGEDDVLTDDETNDPSGTDNGSPNSEGVTDNETRERPPIGQKSPVTNLNPSFEVIGTDTGDLEEAASVVSEHDTVLIRGEILGSNTCYTAGIDSVTITDGTLHVGIMSYEDADEDEGCRDAIIGIEYEATIEITGDLPSSARVEHNGEEITTEQPT